VIDTLLRSKLEPVRSLDRWDAVAALLGAVVAAWILVFKLRAAAALAYTDDLFQFVQLATSWMDGRPFWDHHYGFHLSIHTYFLVLPLGFLARPLGTTGLFLALAFAAGLTAFAAARLARRVGVPGAGAAAFGLLVGASPRAFIQWHDPIYGFHLELLAPPLVLLLVERLLSGKLASSVALALVLLSIKEEMVALVALVAVLALVEQRLGDTAAIEGEGSRRRRFVPAGVVFALAVVYAPIALAILKAARASDPTAVDTFTRVPLLAQAGVHSAGGVLAFALTHVWSWLSSVQVAHALGFALTASFGLALLRPHLIPLMIPLTAVVWLMHDTATWPPRFATQLSIAWVLAALGLGSLVRAVKECKSGRARAALVAPVLVVAAGALAVEVHVLPWAQEVYALEPASPYDAAALAQIDRAFARYRAEATDDEPAAASPHLFGVVRPRALLWYHFLRPEPRPVWILWDEGFPTKRGGLEVYVHDLDAFDVVAREGPFSLRRRRR
jgi:hypothetical protein